MNSLSMSGQKVSHDLPGGSTWGCFIVTGGVGARERCGWCHGLIEFEQQMNCSKSQPLHLNLIKIEEPAENLQTLVLICPCQQLLLEFTKFREHRQVLESILLKEKKVLASL